MKRSLPILAAAALLFGNTAHAQAPALSEEVLTIARDAATGAITVSWPARPGRTYFLQHNPSLVSLTDPTVQIPWIYWPDGSLLRRLDSAQATGLTLGNVIGDRSFFRLKHTDAFPTSDPQAGDADDDRVSNADEINLGLDPFSNVDGDGDGMADDWEKFRFNGSLARNGSGDDDGDGFTDLGEFLFGLNPNANDSTTGLEELSYDALGRLQSARGAGYGYDAEGNLETATN